MEEFLAAPTPPPRSHPWASTKARLRQPQPPGARASFQNHAAAVIATWRVVDASVFTANAAHCQSFTKDFSSNQGVSQTGFCDKIARLFWQPQGGNKTGLQSKFCSSIWKTRTQKVQIISDFSHSNADICSPDANKLFINVLNTRGGGC